MFRKPLILIGFLLVWGAASGVTHDPAYEATVPVADHTEAARNAALREALAQVFDRVSGQPGSASDRSLAPVIRDPTRFIDQFKLENAADGLRVWVRFDQNAVDNTLRDRGRTVVDPSLRLPPPESSAPRVPAPVVESSPRLPPGAAARPVQLPTTLVWLLIREGGQIRPVASSDPEASTVEGLARDRGLTVLLPLLDLQESSRIRPGETWGAGDELLFEMAQRYEAGAVLIGRLDAVGPNQWRGRWSARVGSETQTWEAGAASLKEAIRSGLDQEATLFARRAIPAEPYSPRGMAPVEPPRGMVPVEPSRGMVPVEPGRGMVPAEPRGMVPVEPAPVVVPPGAASTGTSGNTVNVRVADVLGLHDFKRVRDYLGSIPGVRAADTVELSPDSVTVRLTLDGDPAVVLDAIRTGRTLERMPARGGAGGTVEFRLLP